MIRRQNRIKTSQIDAAMEMLRSAGRNGDTELAHVNPREKAILKALDQLAASMKETERDNVSTDEAQSATHANLQGRLG